MEAKAQARFVRVTPQKARRVVNEVRGKAALEVADILRFAPQAVATDVRKVLMSAVANAKVKAEQAGKPSTRQTCWSSKHSSMKVRL